jgi:hypothetical protein
VPKGTDKANFALFVEQVRAAYESATQSYSDPWWRSERVEPNHPSRTKTCENMSNEKNVGDRGRGMIVYR